MSKLPENESITNEDLLLEYKLPEVEPHLECYIITKEEQISHSTDEQIWDNFTWV